MFPCSTSRIFGRKYDRESSEFLKRLITGLLKNQGSKVATGRHLLLTYFARALAPVATQLLLLLLFVVTKLLRHDTAICFHIHKCGLCTGNLNIFHNKCLGFYANGVKFSPTTRFFIFLTNDLSWIIFKFLGVAPYFKSCSMSIPRHIW